MTATTDLDAFRRVFTAEAAPFRLAAAQLAGQYHRELEPLAVALASLDRRELVTAARAESRRYHHRRRMTATAQLADRRAHAEAIASQLDYLAIDLDVDVERLTADSLGNREPSLRPPRCPYLDRPRSHAPPRYVEHRATTMGVRPT